MKLYTFKHRQNNEYCVIAMSQEDIEYIQDTDKRELFSSITSDLSKPKK